jgi:hypothetical protein
MYFFFLDNQGHTGHYNVRVKNPQGTAVPKNKEPLSL